MFDLNFRITNPWSNKFNPLYTKFWKITDNKNLEINVYRSNSIVNLWFKLTLNSLYSGFYFIIGFFGYDFEFDIYNSNYIDRMINKEPEEEILGI
jgi:hypothetical protein